MQGSVIERRVGLAISTMVRGRTAVGRADGRLVGRGVGTCTSQHPITRCVKTTARVLAFSMPYTHPCGRDGWLHCRGGGNDRWRATWCIGGPSRRLL
jgi:hypothetical protein